jgi:hypothetical protein
VIIARFGRKVNYGHHIREPVEFQRRLRYIVSEMPKLLLVADGAIAFPGPNVTPGNNELTI